MRWKEIINETASGGASAAGNVASCISPLGCGFGDNYEASIYGAPKSQSKPPILRRSNIASKSEKKNPKL